MNINLKIVNPEKLGNKKLSISLIALLIISEILFLYIFFSFSKSLGLILIFVSVIVFYFLLEFFNKILSSEDLFLEAQGSKLIVRGEKGTREFDLKICKLEYHSDKDEWLSLRCSNGQSHDWVLVRPVSKEAFEFVNQVNFALLQK